MSSLKPSPKPISAVIMPAHLDLYYGGAWHKPLSGSTCETFNPSTGEVLATVAEATKADAQAAIAAARSGFAEWRRVAPLERGKILRQISARIREHLDDIALLDAANGGNPVSYLRSDVDHAASLIDFFAGLVTEIKGDTIPMGLDAVNFTMREPLGVVARINGFNHPFMFNAARIAAPLAAGNAVIIKPPQQAPLSGLRLAELVGDLLPPGVLSVLPGAAEVGAALASDPGVDMVTLVGSVPTGRAVYQAGAATMKPVILELGGKNALIACADADPAEIASAAVKGMNFTWCGQSCGSTSRLFLHESIYDKVLERIPSEIAPYRPGIATEPDTIMGALVSRKQHDSVSSFIESGRSEGARLLCGGGSPTDARLQGGYFIEPTVFADVTTDMRIAHEEIFGPVLSVLRWSDEAEMLQAVNAVEYGLTCSVYSNHIDRAHRIAAEVDVGYVWINTVGTHFIGAPFGGVKQSGIGRDECLGELISCTREKNIHVKIRS